MSQASPTPMSATGTGWPRTVPARLRPNAPPPVSFAYAIARSAISPGDSFRCSTSIVALRRARVPERSRSISSTPDPSALRSDWLTSVLPDRSIVLGRLARTPGTVSPPPVKARSGGAKAHGRAIPFPAASALLQVALRRDPFRAASGALVLDLDLGLAYRVAHRLGEGVGLLAQPDLLDHPRLLVDDRLLAALGGRNLLLLEHVVAGLDRALDRAALDLDPLLAQADLLLDRALDDVAAHPHPAAADLALADPDLLLDDRNCLLALAQVTGGALAGQPRAGRGGAGRSGAVAGRGGGAPRELGGRHPAGHGAGLVAGPAALAPALGPLVDVHRAGLLQDVARPVLHPVGDAHAQQVPAAPQALGVGVPVLLRREQVGQAGQEALVLVSGRGCGGGRAGARTADRDTVARDAERDEPVARRLGGAPRVVHRGQDAFSHRRVLLPQDRTGPRRGPRAARPRPAPSGASPARARSRCGSSW